MRSYACMGKVLWVNLTTKETWFEKIPHEDYKNYLTGYGLGAKIIYERLPVGVDPLSKDNILGFMSGLLTGTKAFFTGRYCVIGKSPLTNTWGDANSGGHFAPAIKEIGVDGIFFIGKSEEPVYLYANGGKIELKSTKYINELGEECDLWGQGTSQTEDQLKFMHGSKYRVSCIGQSGEQVSLLAGITTDGGRLAARSGLGALMGSKNLKALCLSGSEDINVFDQKTIIKENQNFAKAFKHFKHPTFDYVESLAATTDIGESIVHYLTQKGKFNPGAEADRYVMTHWGTPGVVSFSADIGDSPIKNWQGTAKADFPASKSTNISNNSVTDLKEKKYGCYSCPMRCGGIMKDKIGKYNIGKSHTPEYETLCGFGSLLKSDELDNIVLINEKLNNAGMDSISAAVTVSWIYELVDKNLIDSNMINSDEIQWENNNGAVHLVDEMVNGSGIGKYLRHGIKRSIDELISNGFIKEKDREEAFECGMVVGGQEVPMHDPRDVKVMGAGLGVGYEAEPTPGRHTSTLSGADEYYEDEPKDKNKTLHLHPMRSKKTLPPKNEIGKQLKTDSCFMDLINGLGLCAFGPGGDVKLPLVKYINAATGWNYDFTHYMKCAERIKVLRHSFNVREGVDIRKIKLPARIRDGIGLYEGHTFDEVKDMYFEAMGYRLIDLYPKECTLDDLGLDFVKKSLYEKE